MRPTIAVQKAFRSTDLKTLLTSALLFCAASFAFGQGQVNFANSAIARSKISINSDFNGPATGLMPGTNSVAYYFELFVGPTNVVAQGSTLSTLDPTLLGFVDTGYTATNTTAAGRILLEQNEADANGYADISGYAPGQPADFVVVGWSASLGSTWAEVQPAMDLYQYYSVLPDQFPECSIGESDVAQLTLGGGTNAVPNIFGNAPSAQGFVLKLVEIFPSDYFYRISFTLEPTNEIVPLGSTAQFAAGASGPELSYQWSLNEATLTGATSNVLTITNAQVADAGTYVVVVSNPGYSVRSSAVLQVGCAIIVNGQQVAGNVQSAGPAQISMSSFFPNGYMFYTLDGTIPTVNSSFYTGPFTITNTTTIQVLNFSEDFSQSTSPQAVTVQIPPPLTGYNLETSALGAGTIYVNPASGPYPSNSVVVLTASAAPNWAFAYWTNAASGTQNPISITMDSSLNVEAVFVQSAYPLTLSTPGGGAVTANGQTISPVTYYPAGSDVTLSATASPGWSFLGWEGSATTTNNPAQLIMDETNVVQAIFGTVVSTDAVVGGGNIVLSQPNPIPYGANIAVSAVPNPGKYFVTWSGAASGTNSPTSITVTSATPTVNALFVTLPGGKCSLSAIVNGSGTVNISAQQSYYDPGTAVTLTAIPNPGFTFYGWTLGAMGTTNPLTVVVSSNTIIQANFVGYPSVSVSPSSLVLLAGSNAVLTANAAGLPPLSYQWQDNEGLIGGATNSTYSMTNAQNSDVYSVIVSNPFGVVTSAVATVTVVSPPGLTAQPVDEIVAAGAPVTLSVSASGTGPLGYQWWNNEGPIAGATNAQLAFNPAETNDWDNYFVVLTNAYGAVTSSVAALVVYGPVTISAGPASEVVTAGATVTLSVAASGYPAPQYQWSLNGTNLPGATASSLTLSKVQLTNMGSYQVSVSNAYSGQVSAPAILSMSPSIVTPYTGATAIWGLGTVLSVVAEGSGALSYQWFQNGAAIAGATNAVFSLPTVQFTNAGLYSVVVSSALGSVTNTPALLVVNPAGLSVGMCASITLTGVPGYTYIIQYTTDLQVSNSWITLTNLTLDQPVELWVDTTTNALTAQHRFYQVLPDQ